MDALPYKIEQTVERTAVDTTGRLRKYIDIHFRTAAGDTGTVEIPKEDFTAEFAQTMIQQRIEELAKLRGLM